MKVRSWLFLVMVLLITSFVPACVSVQRDTDTLAVLQKAAALLRAEKLDAEAGEIEDAAARITESRRQRKASVSIGFAPDERLKEDAAKLREMGRNEAASKLEEYANAYWGANLKSFMRQQSLRTWDKGRVG